MTSTSTHFVEIDFAFVSLVVCSQHLYSDLENE